MERCTIHTPHDRIHDYGAHPTHTALPVSDWHSQALWGGTPPGAGAIVMVTGTVSFNANDLTPYAVIVVPAGATLDLSGRLRVGTLIVCDGGTLLVRPGAHISIIPQPFAAEDTAQYGRGLIVLGRIEVSGTYKVGVCDLHAPAAGDRELIMDADVAGAGWLAGDLLLLTRCYADMFYENPKPACERVVVESVSEHRVTVVGQLGGRYEPNGVSPWACNMTRDIKIFSEDPANPGHILITHTASGFLRNVEIINMGRTTLAPDSQIGRYAVHLHHLIGPFRITGVTVRWSDPHSDKKWGVAVHNSHHCLLQEVVVAGAAHSGIATEDGSEYRNTFINCTAVDCVAPPGEFAGYGFWLNGCARAGVVDCRAALCSYGLGFPGLLGKPENTVPEYPGESPPTLTFSYAALTYETLDRFTGLCNGIDIWFEHKKGRRYGGLLPVVWGCVSSMPWSPGPDSGSGLVAYDTDGMIVDGFTGYSSHINHQSNTLTRIVNSRFAGAGPGVWVFAGGSVEVSGCDFGCNPAIRVGFTAGVGAGPLPAGDVQTVTVTGCQFSDWTLDLVGTPDGSPSRAPIAGHTVTIDGTRHYWPSQAPDAPCPGVGDIPDDPLMLKLAAPHSGMTNLAASVWRWRPNPANPYEVQYALADEVVGQPGWQVVCVGGHLPE